MKASFIATFWAVAALAVPQVAHAEFPDRPVTMIVGFAAGGGTDTLARIIATELQKKWNQSVVVENQPGADGSIAAASVADAAPDGYTIAVISNGHTVTPTTMKLPYKPIDSFAPITEIASQPDLLLVNPKLPVKTVQDLITLAKSEPGKLSFGSSGSGTTPYLAMELLMQKAGIDMVHVPYKGTAPAILGIISGEVDLLFGAVSSSIAYVNDGKLNAIAVSSKEPNPAAPDVPTVASSGIPGFEALTWYGILAPAGTPADVVDTLNKSIVDVLKTDAVSKRLFDLGFDVVANSPSAFTDVIRTDIDTWHDVLAKAKK
jgi:tripartite-type tricarboxylate transporter receptor subunit TctC